MDERLVEKKVEAEIELVKEPNGEVIGCYKGLIHLFEFKYSEFPSFWFGVMEIIDEDGAVFKEPRDYILFFNVILEDGRRGFGVLSGESFVGIIRNLCLVGTSLLFRS